MADPVIQAPTDAIVRVELAAICGSDLHVWFGRETGLDPGTVMGHEFVGEVVEIGRDVSRIRRGQRVASPFTTSCGACFYCQSGLTARCVRGQLFGWVERGSGLQGAQAELVRVPLADGTLFPLPGELAPEAGLLLGDVLATGYHCATLAGTAPGTSRAVVGCGPVGLMAILAARELGAEPIFTFDSVPARWSWAERLGATPGSIATGHPLDAVRQASEGRGIDAVVGVRHEAAFSFSPGQAYDKNLSYRIGRCPARRLRETGAPALKGGAATPRP